MLTGTHPWPNFKTPIQAFFKIAKSKKGPPLPPNISKEAVSFLENCLRINPFKRLNTRKLLLHPFLNNVDIPKAPSEKCSLEKQQCMQKAEVIQQRFP